MLETQKKLQEKSKANLLQPRVSWELYLCCMSSESYGRNGVTKIFRYFFTELPVPPQATGVVGTLNCVYIYIYISHSKHCYLFSDLEDAKLLLHGLLFVCVHVHEFC